MKYKRTIAKTGLPEFANTKEIANHLGVHVSAVSNWKQRFPNFPKAIARGVYRSSEVIAWLEHRDKPCPCIYCPTIYRKSID